MFVGERMSHPPITVTPETSIHDAMHLMRTEHIRRAPVVSHGHLVGIVSLKDLVNASPSPATTLSVWELNYLLSKLTVDRVMTRDVYTVSVDTPIEEAARIMADRRVGGLPVMRGNELVGIITETDLFKIFLELMGARNPGIRVTVSMTDEPGSLAKLTAAIANSGGNIIALGTFAGETAAMSEVTFKVSGITMDQVREVITSVVAKVIDVRESHP
ncbi:CBS and ACT domain-containing protein [Chloroflexus sp.]|uniref:CBS and ACT domain-containing protein n=1 Tax=Chloroflexus sp. TaxID=1904827 RepID=UPI002ACD7D5D|nr:CBS and ACT domain-containing protein [Chloroflexus sp.]